MPNARILILLMSIKTSRGLMQPISTENLINCAVVRCKYDLGMILSNLILKHVY